MPEEIERERHVLGALDMQRDVQHTHVGQAAGGHGAGLERAAEHLGLALDCPFERTDQSLFAVIRHAHGGGQRLAVGIRQARQQG